MYRLTEQGRTKAEAYIRELEAKRKEILDAGLDTIDDCGSIVSLEAIEDDLEDFTDDTGEYLNGWYVTDNYDADYPLGLYLGEDFVEVKGD